MATPQQAAVASAQNLAALAVQIQQLGKAMNAWMTDYNQNIWDTIWSKLNTVAVEADGTTGLVDTVAGSGTVAVTNGQAAITFSASQTGLVGKYLTVTGDPTNGVYPILSGSGTAWVLGMAFAGSTGGTSAWGIATPVNTDPISVSSGILPTRNALITLKTAVATLQTVISQASGTVTMQNQAIIQSCALVSPNTI